MVSDAPWPCDTCILCWLANIPTLRCQESIYCSFELLSPINWFAHWTVAITFSTLVFDVANPMRRTIEWINNNRISHHSIALYCIVLNALEINDAYVVQQNKMIRRRKLTPPCQLMTEWMDVRHPFNACMCVCMCVHATRFDAPNKS